MDMIPTINDDSSATGEGGEALFCRICHMPSETDNALYHPCKCSGSIKYVHQECLLEWLKVSRRQNPKCELCGVEFRFLNIYENGAPLSLTILDMIYELIPRVQNFGKVISSVTLLVCMWVIVFPLYITTVTRISYGILLQTDVGFFDIAQWTRILAKSGSLFFSQKPGLKQLVSDWYNGLGYMCIIFLASFGLHELLGLIAKEVEISNKKFKMRLLEMKMKENLEEDRLRLARIQEMALADFFSLKYHWDSEKALILRKDPSGKGTLNLDMRYSEIAARRLLEGYATTKTQHFKDVGESYVALHNKYREMKHLREVCSDITGVVDSIKAGATEFVLATSDTGGNGDWGGNSDSDNDRDSGHNGEVEIVDKKRGAADDKNTTGKTDRAVDSTLASGLDGKEAAGGPGRRRGYPNSSSEAAALIDLQKLEATLESALKSRTGCAIADRTYDDGDAGFACSVDRHEPLIAAEKQVVGEGAGYMHKQSSQNDSHDEVGTWRFAASRSRSSSSPVTGPFLGLSAASSSSSSSFTEPAPMLSPTLTPTVYPSAAAIESDTESDDGCWRTVDSNSRKETPVKQEDEAAARLLFWAGHTTGGNKREENEENEEKEAEEKASAASATAVATEAFQQARARFEHAQAALETALEMAAAAAQDDGGSATNNTANKAFNGDDGSVQTYADTLASNLQVRESFVAFEVAEAALHAEEMKLLHSKRRDDKGVLQEKEEEEEEEEEERKKEERKQEAARRLTESGDTTTPTVPGPHPGHRPIGLVVGVAGVVDVNNDNDVPVAALPHHAAAAAAAPAAVPPAPAAQAQEEAVAAAPAAVAAPRVAPANLRPRPLRAVPLYGQTYFYLICYVLIFCMGIMVPNAMFARYLLTGSTIQHSPRDFWRGLVANVFRRIDGLDSKQADIDSLQYLAHFENTLDAGVLLGEDEEDMLKILREAGADADGAADDDDAGSISNNSDVKATAEAILFHKLYQQLKIAVEVSIGLLIVVALLLLAFFVLHIRNSDILNRAAEDDTATTTAADAQKTSFVVRLKQQLTTTARSVHFAGKLILLVVLYLGIVPNAMAFLIFKSIYKTLPDNVVERLNEYEMNAVQVFVYVVCYLAALLLASHITTILDEIRPLLKPAMLNDDFFPIALLANLHEEGDPAVPGVQAGEAAQHVHVNVNDDGAAGNLLVDAPAAAGGDAAPPPILEGGNAVGPPVGIGGAGVAAGAGAGVGGIGGDAVPAAAFPGTFFKKLHRMSYFTLLKRCIFRTALLLPAIAILITLPLRFGHLLIPGAGAKDRVVFRLKYVSVLTNVQIPIEMILSHVLIPIIIDKLQYRHNVRVLLMSILSVTPLLSLEWMLNMEQFPDLILPAAVPAVAEVAPAEVPTVDEIPAVINTADTHAELVFATDGANDSDEGDERRGGGGGGGDDAARDNDIDVNVPDAIADDDGEPQIVAFAAEEHQPQPQQHQQNEEQQRNRHYFMFFFEVFRSLASYYLPTPVRLGILALAALTVTCILSSLTIHAPLVVGRIVLGRLAGIPPHNDLFNFPIGAAVCWSVLQFLQYIIKDILGNMNGAAVFTATKKWTLITLQVLAVSSFWLLVPPLLLGVLLEAVVVTPLRVPLYETPRMPFVQCWAMGLVFLKVWCRFVLTGLFGEPPIRIQLEMLMIRGFEHFEAKTTLRGIVAPVTIFLLDYLLIPYFLSRVACVFVDSYLIRTVMVRYCIHFYIVVRGLVIGLMALRKYLVALHNEVRDTKYLVGTRLTNRGE